MHRAQKDQNIHQLPFFFPRNCCWCVHQIRSDSGLNHTVPSLDSNLMERISLGGRSTLVLFAAPLLRLDEGVTVFLERAPDPLSAPYFVLQGFIRLARERGPALLLRYSVLLCPVLRTVRSQ